MNKPLPKICKIQYGYAFDSAKFSDSQGVPLIRIRDVVRGYSETYTTEKASDEYFVNDGDMLIGMDGEFNIAHWKGGKAYLNQRVCQLIPTDEVDALYLFYFMPKALKAIEDKTPFVTVKHLSAKELNKVIVPIPSMEEQRKIAGSLQKVDELIALRKEQLAKLDQLVKSQFIELFGDLKSNPYNWECKNLLDVADIDTVMVSDYEKYADYPHIGIDSIEKNTGRLFGYRTIAEDGVISGKYLFTEKHIIYSKIRPNLNKVALPDFDGLCSADAYPILPKENICLRIYLGYVMRSEFFLDYILPFSRRANMPKVNKEQLSGFVLPVPNIELQQQFAAFVEQTDKSKLAIQQSLDKLELLKKSLMQQYFG